MGQVLDGFADHMKQYEARYTFVLSDERAPTEEEVVETLRSSRAQMLLNYLPVGSEAATRFYVGCALKANIGVINNIPVFIASDPDGRDSLRAAAFPSSETMSSHSSGRPLFTGSWLNLFRNRGVKLERTYQLNTGGNTDFLNMLDRSRLVNKKRSKTESVQSQLGEKRLDPENIHIGPSDWVAWQKDNKVCLYPDGRQALRGHAHEPGSAAFRGGFPQLRWCGDRRHPVLQARPRQGQRGHPSLSLRLFHEKSPEAIYGRLRRGK